MPIDSRLGDCRLEAGDGPRRYSAGEVPAEVTVDLGDAVGEAVDGLERDRSPLDDAGHHPAAGRAEVDGGEDAGGMSAQEGGGHAGVDRDEQAGGVAELVGA